MKKETNKKEERIRKFGEVFTPDKTVEDMLNLNNDEFIRFDARILEPACGDGNFLDPILKLRTNRINKLYKNNKLSYEKALFKSLSSLYGVDILEDNIEKCILRLHNTCKKSYQNTFKDTIDLEFLRVLKLVLEKNIIQGDALKFTNKNKKPLFFFEWVMLRKGNVKIREFEFVEIADFDQSRPTLFSKREVNDLGESVFSPQPSYEYELIYFKKISPDFFNS